MFRKRELLLGALLANLGCTARPLRVLAQSPTAGASPCYFWPPPPSTETWREAPGAAQRLAERAVASNLEARLRAAGYSEQRWYPIGTRHEHGFAVTTRLEQVDSANRWSPVYPTAANLKWLTLARTIPLSRPGDYRVLLIAYTDLPVGLSAFAEIWSDQTMMDGPGAREDFSAAESSLPERQATDYEFGVYEYDYQWDGREARGTLRIADRAASHDVAQPPDRVRQLLR